MHPSLSVIFFTVVSGAGYGAFMVLAVTGLFTWLPAMFALAVCTTSLVLVTLGLVSSTFHLANPVNAWRAFSRFKTSWLSREGVLAVAFYPIAFGYMALWWLDAAQLSNPLWVLLSMLTGLTALATVFSTGMIYACLKTIRQWNTALTPVNYIVLSLMLGCLLLLAQQKMFAQGQVSLYMLEAALVFLFLGMLTKMIYYAWIASPQGPTINTATGFTRAAVHLFDVGHTAGTFLTDEFGYQLARTHRTLLRWLVFVLGFIVPALLLVGMLAQTVRFGAAALTAFLISLTGIFIERWLFFAEARHVVNLYHGAQRT